MEPIIRAVIMYFFLLLIIRITGKRTLSEITVFDFLLILLIGDASQQGITGDDYSIINTVLIITTLILLDILLSKLKKRNKKINRMIDGSPLLIVHDGECIQQNCTAANVTKDDVLACARKSQGLENLSQIKYAVLEKSGAISIIPYHNDEKNSS